MRIKKNIGKLIGGDPEKLPREPETVPAELFQHVQHVFLGDIVCAGVFGKELPGKTLP